MESDTTSGYRSLRIGMIGCEDLPKWNGRDCSKYAARIFEQQGLGQGQPEEHAMLEDEATSDKNGSTDSSWSSPRIEWSYFDATLEDLPKYDSLKDFDGFIMTGSHYGVNDNLPWIGKLETWIRDVRYFQNNNKQSPRVVATCFSHQLVCKAFGGVVGKNPQGKFVWNRESVRLTENAKEHPFFKHQVGNLKELCYSLYESHGDCVLQVPAEAKNLGDSISCTYEILSFGDDIISIQAHPEFTEHEMATLILPALKTSNLISDDEASKEMEAFKSETDGKVIMKLIEKYFARA